MNSKRKLSFCKHIKFYEKILPHQLKHVVVLISILVPTLLNMRWFLFWLPISQGCKCLSTLAHYLDL